MRTADRLRAGAEMALRRPGTVLDYARARTASRRPGAAADPDPAAAGALAPGDAASRLGLDGPGTGPALTRVETWRARANAVARTLAGDPALGRLCYELVRGTRPARIVETGVATGVTTAYLLAGLEDNGSGLLESIDLPPLELIAAGQVGAAVPPELQARWRLHWGSSRRQLPRILRRPEGVGLFVHDSEHGYETMRWELERAWEALAPGGWLVADDAGHHRAVADVAAAAGVAPVYVRQPGKAGTTGLIGKPR